MPLIQNGRYYRLTDPFKSEVCAWEIVGNSQEEVLLNVVMEEIHGNMTVNYVQLRGLDESALYKEQTTGRIYSGAALEPWMGRCDDCGFEKPLSEKANINVLKPDEEFIKSYQITVH